MMARGQQHLRRNLLTSTDRIRLRQRRRRVRLTAIALLITAMVLSACTFGSEDPPPTTEQSSSSANQVPDPGTGAANAAPVGLKLSAGQAQSTAEPVQVITGDPLDEPQAQQVIDRLPAWDPNAAPTVPFQWPAQTIQPPQAGTTVETTFPATGPAPAQDPADLPLEVLRIQPEGEVSLAPFITITFNQPMVPVATLGQLADLEAPATISPELPGSWQWMGTNTLRFDYDASDEAIPLDRLPMATDYTVTVPAGVTSATGATLEEAVTSTFSTPPLSVTDFAPTDTGLPLNPVFVATFDQQIDQQAVLDQLSVTANGEVHAVRLATEEEIAADDKANILVQKAEAGRWLAFRPVEPFGTDVALNFEFPIGTPSAEGPVTTSETTSFRGQTYAALKIADAECAYSDCYPGSSLQLTFSNELDPDLFDPTTITVSPEISGSALYVTGNTLVIDGATQASTEYTITAPAGLTDVFGQQLGADESRTLSIRDEGPRLDGFPQLLTTLDPLAPNPSVTVNTVNRLQFRERVFAVTIDDWDDYQSFVQDALYSGSTEASALSVPDWPVLIDRVVDIEQTPNQLVQTTLDLTEALAGQPGHLVILIEPTAAQTFSSDDSWRNQPTATWAQSTTIGLDALSDSSSLRVWATDLRDGSALPGVEIAAVGTASTAVSDSDGIAVLPATNEEISLLAATSGNQTAILTSGWYGSGWTVEPVDDEVRWYVNDDRQTYRPGETVSVKGWARTQGIEVGAQLALAKDGQTVEWRAVDGQGVEIADGSVDLGSLGGFDFILDLPDGASLGTGYIELTLKNSNNSFYQHQFQIADFRRPDFEVSARTDSQGPYVLNSPLTLAADVNYYAGGPLAATPVDWQVQTAAASYAPPGHDDFSFGVWTPWWLDSKYDYGNFGSDIYGYGYPSCCGEDASEVQEFAGTTDADGSNYLQVQVGDLGPDYAGLPVTVTSQATATDVNRQSIAGSTSVLVHPAELYVGLSSTTTFVPADTPLLVNSLVTDIDGNPVTGRTFEVKAALITSSWINGELVETEAEPQICPVTSTEQAVGCTFTPTVGGTYKITAVVADDQGRTSRTELTRWVGGADAAPSTKVAQESLTLIPDKEEYTPGETAEVLVQSPIANGTGLLTLVRGSIVSTKTFAVANGAAVLQIPLAAEDLPGVEISVEVVGATPRTGPDGAPATDGPSRPAFATGSVRLQISTESRELVVTATPSSDQLTPGSNAQIAVSVVDSTGNAVPDTEFEIVVVDEAVLALSGYELPDPLDVFYAPLRGYINTVYGRSNIMLADIPTVVPGGEQSGVPQPAATQAAESAAGMAVDASAADAAAPTSRAGSTPENPQQAPIAVRQNFDALVTFQPEVVTDAQGKATVDITLPDSLTRYRVMVVAVAGVDKFGTAEANLTAQLPLSVRPSAPRFLNFGDTLELPVVVQNQTDTAMDVDVVLQTSNLTSAGAPGQRVSVPANDRVEVRFPVSAEQSGKAAFRVAVVSGDYADAATVDLPVYTPATSESFATYGVVDGPQVVAQPVTAPAEVIPQFGGLTISTSSTALQELTDAVLYLTDYRYESSDGLAAQILAIATLGEVLDAFAGPDALSPDELRSQMVTKIEKLVALQNDDGGFAYWQRGDTSWPFNSIQSAQALTVAAAKGFSVPPGVLEQATVYLQEIESHFPADYDQETKDTLKAYSLNVLMQGGNRDTASALELFQSRGTELSLDAIAWLWPVLDDQSAVDAIMQQVNNAAVDTAGAVTFTNSVTDSTYLTLQSNPRTDALLLDSLISVAPDSDLIPKVVNGLMGSRNQGRWATAQENSFSLLALKHYFDTYENVAPNFTSSLWLGEKFAGDHPYVGYSTDRTTVTVPTAELIAAGDTAVTVSNDGTGRLYYRIGLQTAPVNLQADPLDRGFVVSRTYEAVDDPADVTQDSDGNWQVKAGATVRVKISLVAQSARNQVALIDPIPAGLEILNAELATTPQDLTGEDLSGEDSAATGFGYWTWSWFNHQNLRDDRAEAFAEYLPAGVYEYTYLARATTIGSFVVPPPRAEEIYAPETFGRGSSSQVVVTGSS